MGVTCHAVFSLSDGILGALILVPAEHFQGTVTPCLDEAVEGELFEREVLFFECQAGKRDDLLGGVWPPIIQQTTPRVRDCGQVKQKLQR